jgi:hypothetical protein
MYLTPHALDIEKPVESGPDLGGEAGAPGIEVPLPEGLDWRKVAAAVRVIEEWETSESENAVALVISLFCLFDRSRKDAKK